jgi:hypothetical protein
VIRRFRLLAHQRRLDDVVNEEAVPNIAYVFLFERSTFLVSAKVFMSSKAFHCTQWTQTVLKKIVLFLPFLFVLSVIIKYKCTLLRQS